MKKITLTMLVACVCLEAGCSRPTAETPITAASPTPPPLTQEERRRDAAAAEVTLERKRAIQERKMAVDPGAEPAVPMTEAVIAAPSPSTPKP